MTESVLILVRHGATAANLLRPSVLQGRETDGELSEHGEAQARAVAQEVQQYPIVQVYCSPLQRSMQTARLIAEDAGLPVEMAPGFAEVDMGRWAGLTWPEVERGWPEAHRAFHADPERHGYLGGENLAQVRERALPAVEDLLARRGGQTFLVVGHGTVNRVLLAHWLGMPLRHA